ADGDGNDADAVHALVGEAAARARAGEGPSFLEFATYRWLEHCGPIDDRAFPYRQPGEWEYWRARDPLAAYERRLAAEKIVVAEDMAKMRAEIGAEIEAAIRFAKDSPYPARDTLMDRVWA
ncbi:MAG: thiamine pyrophosphate-dependent dehydrogenase E1 component subunit alpha, partial [Alphaproteobacteria bacterium]|nr:thiamine pyrophosphate-dependent dehydrogenase E1 component subunit alpha [Alphaproteobacteria bacterium]